MPMTAEERNAVRPIVSEVEQLLIQALVVDAEYVIHKAIRAAVEAQKERDAKIAQAHGNMVIAAAIRVQTEEGKKDGN